jgi:hypothetical protein
MTRIKEIYIEITLHLFIYSVIWALLFKSFSPFFKKSVVLRIYFSSLHLVHCCSDRYTTATHFTIISRSKSHGRQITVTNPLRLLHVLNMPLFAILEQSTSRTLWKCLSLSLSLSPFREGSSPGMTEHFAGAGPHSSINFEGILSCDHGNFEEPNKVLETYRLLLINVLLLLLLSSSSSPLCGVFILIFLRQTVSLGNTVLQLFCCYYSRCLYR